MSGENGTTKGQRLLAGFTKAWFDVDPAGASASGRSDEYEIEAIDSLALFNKHHVGALAELAIGVAVKIVDDVLLRWFGLTDCPRSRALAEALVGCYHTEQANPTA